jgi:hypothetical protein
MPSYVNTFPELPAEPVATQKELVAQDTSDSTSSAPSAAVADQLDPSYVNACPLPATATQKDVVGHETSFKPPPGSSSVGSDHLLPSNVST